MKLIWPPLFLRGENTERCCDQPGACSGSTGVRTSVWPLNLNSFLCSTVNFLFYVYHYPQHFAEWVCIFFFWGDTVDTLSQVPLLGQAAHRRVALSCGCSLPPAVLPLWSPAGTLSCLAWKCLGSPVFSFPWWPQLIMEGHKEEEASSLASRENNAGVRPTLRSCVGSAKAPPQLDTCRCDSFPVFPPPSEFHLSALPAINHGTVTSISSSASREPNLRHLFTNSYWTPTLCQVSI